MQQLHALGPLAVAKDLAGLMSVWTREVDSAAHDLTQPASTLHTPQIYIMSTGFIMRQQPAGDVALSVTGVHTSQMTSWMVRVVWGASGELHWAA